MPAHVTTNRAGSEAAGQSSWSDSLVRRAEEDAFTVVALAVYALALVGILLPGFFVQDTWLSLVAGREIVDHGLPTEDTLTIWGRGSEWTDQQWLAHLALYGVTELAGLAVFGLVLFAVLIATYGLALAAARRRPATSRNVLIVGAPGLLLLPLSTARGQLLALPLFVALVWLLSDDARRPSGRVFVALPLVAVWANVHGSVVLGVVLVLAHCAIAALRERHHGERARSLARLGALAVASVAAVFASPYGLGLLGYYETLIVDPPFGDLILEWRPPAPSLGTAPFFLAAFGVVWLIGRIGRNATPFDVAALLLTMTAAMTAQRNTIWFALTVVVVVPGMLEHVLPPTLATNRRVNLAAAVASAAVVVGSLAYVATRPESAWLSRWSFAGADAAARASARENAAIMATDRTADFLLWTHPELRGRIALDVRFEVYSRRQIERYVDFKAVSGLDWLSASACCRILVLDRRDDGALLSALERGKLAQRLFTDERLVVLERGPLRRT